MIVSLSAQQVEACLGRLPGWTYDDARGALFRFILFTDFSEAFAMMTRIALAAEQADHHPEWSNVYNRLDIWLTTHDANGVSQRDIALAERISGMLPLSSTILS